MERKKGIMMSYRAPDRDYIWLDPAMNVLKNCVEGIWKPIATNLSYSKVEKLIVEQLAMIAKMNLLEELIKAGIPEVLSKIGDLDKLYTYNLTNLVFAVNEVIENLGVVKETIKHEDSKLLRQIDSLEDDVEKVLSKVDNKLDKLVSGTNIKTVNGESLLGSGNVEIKSINDDIIDGSKLHQEVRMVGELLEFARFILRRGGTFGLQLENKTTTDGTIIVIIDNVVFTTRLLYNFSPSYIWEITNPKPTDNVEVVLCHAGPISNVFRYNLYTGIAEDKQNKLIAGDGITIANDGRTISSNSGKPEGGWSKEDMSAGVQSSLNKADTALQQHLDISGKVDKVSGKGLSTNDYTNEEKTKLSNLTNDVDNLKANKVNTVPLTFQEGDTFSITGKDIFSYGPYTVPHYRLVDVDDEEYEYGAGRYLVFCLNHVDGASPEESVRSYALYKETEYPEFSFCCLYDWGDYDSIPQWVLYTFDDDLRGEINTVKSEVTSVQSDLENILTTVSTDCTKYCLFGDIDTLLGSTVAEVMVSLRTQNAMRYVVQYKYAPKQIIPVGIIEMFTDCMRHCVTQIFKTNYAITAAGIVDPNTHSHVLREYVRYYNVAWDGTDYYGAPWPIGTWTIWHEHNNTEIPLNMEVTYEDDTTETFVIYGKKVVED